MTTAPPEDPFRTLFEVLPSGAVLLAPLYTAGGELTDFRFHLLNPAAQRLLGLPAQPDGTLLQAMPYHGSTGLFGHYRQAYLSGEKAELEQTYSGDGFESRYHIVLQRTGELLLVHFTDLATLDAGRVEEELRQSRLREQAGQRALERQRRQWEQLLLHAPVAICVFDGPEWVYEFLNPRYQALFPGRELLGKRMVDALPELTAQPLMHILRRVYETGIPYEGEAVLVRLARTADGPIEDIYFDLTYQARRNEQGEIDGFVTYAADVTTRVLAQQAREASARRLRLLTDALPVLIAYLDRNVCFQFVNEAYRAWFGHDPATLLGRPVYEITGRTAYQALQSYTVRALAGERVDFELRMPYQPDVVRYIRGSYVPDMRDGEVRGFYSLISDVTEQVQSRQQVQHLNEELAATNEELAATNEELYQSNHQLLRANAELDSFVYTASHDLRAPIANIEGLLSALREELPFELLQPASSVSHLLRLLDNSIARFQETLLYLTSVMEMQKAGSQPRLLDEVDVAALVEHVRQDVASSLQASQGRLLVDVSGCPRVRLPLKDLRSIFFNLISNAIKYRAPHRAPVVRVHFTCAHPMAVLTVQDNGLGLSQAQQTELFRLFRRLHAHVEGTGVGLYSIKKLIDNAGGTITVDSAVDVGSTFTVRLPL